MTKLPYLRTMFATCMLFQVLFVACVALWLIAPGLKGHTILATIFPQFLTDAAFQDAGGDKH